MVVSAIYLDIGRCVSYRCLPAYLAAARIKCDDEAGVLIGNVYQVRLGIDGYPLWTTASMKHPNDRKSSIRMGGGRKQEEGKRLYQQGSYKGYKDTTCYFSFLELGLDIHGSRFIAHMHVT